MKKLAVLCGAAIAFALSAPAFAQSTASVTSTASIKIIRPIAISKVSDLSFGSVVRPVTGSGTVVIAAADGTRTVSGGVATGPGGTGTRAEFTVGGEGGEAFSISIPATVTMTRAEGSETMVATLSATSTSGTLDSSLGSQGAASFGVGASLPVDASTATGNYSGTFTVTVSYN